MQTHFIEATDEHQFNHGKFMLGRFTPEQWTLKSALPDYPNPLLRGRGWGARHLFIMDLETGEGAMFHMVGTDRDMSHQLQERHQIWVCPMFEPFLWWLVTQDLEDLSKLPRFVQLTDASRFCALRRERMPGSKINRQ